jgi:MFS family permease
LLALPMAGTGFTSVALIFHQTALFAERGLGPEVAAAAFVPFAVASASGTFLAGFLVDRFGPKNVLLANLLLLAIPPFLLLFIESTLGAVVYAALLGSSVGIEQVISRATWAHFYGRIGLGRIQGPAMMLMVIMVAISPFIIAQLEGLTGTYRLGLLLAGSVPIITAPMVALHRAPKLET